jgi:molybdopterin adenylyltransferase
MAKNSSHILTGSCSHFMPVVCAAVSTPFRPLSIAVVTVSDSRGLSDDESGELLAQRLTASGHKLVGRAVVRDEIPAIRAQVAGWIADPTVDVVISNGGTGITGRDVTPEAIGPLLERRMEGFAVAFHQLALQSVGSAAVTSRAMAGVAAGTLVFVLPGSPGACRDAWDGLLGEQLDARHRPCNLVELLPRLIEGPT